MNGASSFWRQEGSILARLRRAIDRYEAVGWHHRAKATNELLRRVSLQQTLASWHEIEKLLMEDQNPFGQLWRCRSPSSASGLPTTRTASGPLYWL